MSKICPFMSYRNQYDETIVCLEKSCMLYDIDTHDCGLKRKQGE